MIYHHDHTNGIPVDNDDDENTRLPDEKCGGECHVARSKWHSHPLDTIPVRFGGRFHWHPR